MVDDKSVREDIQIFNLRLWIDKYTAFVGYPKPSFYFRESNQWLGRYELQKGAFGVQVMPSSMPSYPNVFTRSPSEIMVSGTYLDREFSHFIYVKGFFAPANYHLGTYGGLGLKNFTLRFTYDYTDLNSKLYLPGDLYDTIPYIIGMGPATTLGVGISGYFSMNEHSPRRTPLSGYKVPLATVNMTL